MDAGAAARGAPSAEEAVSREQIAKRAYEIWLESGRAEGRQEENWYQAERELRAAQGTDDRSRALRSVRRS